MYENHLVNVCFSAPKIIEKGVRELTWVAVQIGNSRDGHQAQKSNTKSYSPIYQLG